MMVMKLMFLLIKKKHAICQMKIDTVEGLLFLHGL